MARGDDYDLDHARSPPHFFFARLVRLASSDSATSMSKPLRVLLATPSYLPNHGGLEQLVSGFAKALVDIGCEVTVASQVSPRSPAPPLEYRDGTTVLRYRNRIGGRRFGYAPSLGRDLPRLEATADVVHAFSFHGPVALKVASVTTRPFFFTPVFHGEGHTPLASALHVVYGPLARRIFARADRVLCCTAAERNELIASYPSAEPRTSVMHIAIDAHLFDGVTKIATSSKVVLSACRLDEYKRVDKAIEAMALLDDDVELVICGEGPDRSRLEEIAQRLSPRARITFLGFVTDEELRAWQLAAHVAIGLSTHESFGLSLAEAAASGATIVASDIAAHREMATLVDADATFVDPNATAQSIADAIRSQLARPRRTSDQITTRSWTDVANETVVLYQEAITAPRARSAP